MKLKRRLPWTRVPASILSRHDLDWLAPAGQCSRRSLRSAPPQSSLGRRRASRDPDTREDRVESISSLADAEIEHLHFGWCEDRMLTPASSAVFAFCVSLHEIILMVRSGDVPHFPFAVMIDKVRFVYASVFPRLICSERGFWLICPPLPNPLQIADRVRPPQVLSPTCIVNALHPFACAGVPTLDV